MAVRLRSLTAIVLVVRKNKINKYMDKKLEQGQWVRWENPEGVVNQDS